MALRDMFGRPKHSPELARLLADPVKMAGTTTHGAEALERLFAAQGHPRGGMLEPDGVLTHEPENPADPNAVAVHVEGSLIGYLPGLVAADVRLRPRQDPTCRVQLWGAPVASGLRVIGWVAYGAQPVGWPHTPSNPPAITPTQQRAERAAATARMIDDALTSEDPQRTALIGRGMIGRFHYLETVEPIQQLKRDGRLEDALALCYEAIRGAENDRDGREPAPWYTEQAAIIHRKLGERDREIEVLQRWLAACPPERRVDSKIQQRLDKLLSNGRAQRRGSTKPEITRRPSAGESR